MESKGKYIVPIDYQKIYTRGTGVLVCLTYWDQFNKILQKAGLVFQTCYPFLVCEISRGEFIVLIYHSVPHSQVLSLITNIDEMMFEGKKRVGIAIADYIKLSHRVNDNVFPAVNLRNLQLWLSKYFGAEHGLVSLWKCKNEHQQTEYYLKVTGKSAIKCTFYVFLLANQFGERCRLQNPSMPQNLQKVAG